LEEHPDNLLTLSVFDTETEVTTSVIRDLDTERYEAILDWQGDDSLLVRVLDNQRDNFFTLGYWHVRVVP
jgi:hypothetical protein